MSDDDIARVIVLDVLAHGRSDDDRPGYQREPICYGIREDDFQLYELVFESPPDVGIGDDLPIEPITDLEDLRTRDRVAYDDLSSGAKSEVEYVIEDIVEAREDRFVTFFNEAQPVSLRLHQLNLLPGIGDKLRDGILQARKRQPFQDYEDIAGRVDGLHDPPGILIERILEELKDPDMKYHLFVGPDALLVRG